MVGMASDLLLLFLRLEMLRTGPFVHMSSLHRNIFGIVIVVIVLVLLIFIIVAG